MKQFKVMVGIAETNSGAYGNKPGLIKAQLTAQGVAMADLNSPDPAKLAKALEVCRKEYLSCMILQGSDNTRYYQLKIDLANSMTMKKDEFLKTMVETQRLINNYKMPLRQCSVSGTRTVTGSHLYRTDHRVRPGWRRT